MALKKINLLTFNRALSYGAILQTYALVRVLQSLDYEVEIIDFQAPFIPPPPKGLWTLKTYYNIPRIRRELLFRKFHRKYLQNKTKAFYTSRSLKKFHFYADYYVVGSDQVWNPDITKNYAIQYFLDFVNGTKIAYAASFGKSEWKYHQKLTKDIYDQLTCFRSISVREIEGLAILKEIFKQSGNYVLDPTLLYNDYQKLAVHNGKYKGSILSYNVNPDSNFLGIIEGISAKSKYPVILIGSRSKNRKIKSLPYVKIQEFLGLFSDATLVITDSYHGVIFSIINKKDFFVINNHAGRFSRINSLLNSLGLCDRIIDYDFSAESSQLFNCHIDFSIVDEKLNHLRMKSIEFLRKSLQD